MLSFFACLDAGVCPACISDRPEQGASCTSCISACSGKRPAEYATCASCIYLGGLGLDGQASVHEGGRGIDIFGEYNKGS